MGLDGFRTGGGSGVGGGTYPGGAGACAMKTQAPNIAAHPTIKSRARANLLVDIAVSFEPMFCCQ